LQRRTPCDAKPGTGGEAGTFDENRSPEQIGGHANLQPESTPYERAVLFAGAHNRAYTSRGTSRGTSDGGLDSSANPDISSYVRWYTEFPDRTDNNPAVPANSLLDFDWRTVGNR
jgi:hypothetical protein